MSVMIIIFHMKHFTSKTMFDVTNYRNQKKYIFEHIAINQSFSCGSTDILLTASYRQKSSEHKSGRLLQTKRFQ